MVLTVRNVTKTYVTATRHVTVLDGVDLALDTGQSVALTGESGSGKSTLLHLIATLDHFDSGEIQLDGTVYSTLTEPERAQLRRHRIGIVFQQFNLIPTMTVGQNLVFQARLTGRDDPAWTARIARTLDLADVLDAYPEHLSGGQQQRAAIGRALAVRPRLLLADEPTGNLDEQNSDRALNLMLELLADSGTTLFLVTHSNRLAARLDQHFHLSRGRLT
ncbi:MAG: ABC transporter ATP-binding protein [Rhodobacteraceae bacterium]|nr:ABC transporter ATP-binding protein [Paracoccaceae bacterium]